MDENHQNTVGSKPTATNDKLWIPPLSTKDQQKLDRLRSKGKKSTSNWTGFAGRTLWDWIQFFAVLAIPIIVAIGTLYFTQQITLQQTQLSITASEKQHQTDLQIAADQQQEARLKTCLDDIKDLLLNRGLRESKPGDEVRAIARVDVFTALRQLDRGRKGLLVQFLFDAGLITGSRYDDVIIVLSDADLSGTDLRFARLQGAYLYHAHLRGADLSGADLSLTDLGRADLSRAGLSGADLSSADLSLTDLSFADLSFADLYGTDLSFADLHNADLRHANLYDARIFSFDFAERHETPMPDANLLGTDLSGADLRNATIIEYQLGEAKSLKGATMPDGSKHP